MKFKTKVTQKVQPAKERQNRVIMTIVLLFNMVTQTFIPFVLGVYFVVSENIFAIFFFILLLFFEVKLTMDSKGDIHLSIIRVI